MKEEVIKELKEISEAVAELKMRSVDAGPGLDYFQDLQEKLISEINLHHLLHRNQKQSELPSGYFEGMQDKVMAEINVMARTKSQIEDNDLPSGYFEGLADRVMARVNEKPKSGKLFSLVRYQWAVAATLLLLVGYGIVRYGLNEQSQQIMAKNQVNKSYDALLNEISDEDASLLIEHFSTEEDLQFLKNHQDVKDLPLNADLPNVMSDEELDLELTEEDLEYLKTIM